MSISVSVITVTLNSAKTLRECIYSVRSQSYKNIQHIIKDGNSHDGTLEIANTFVETGNIIVSDDCGIYDAMNQGFEHATGDVICFLNSDDIFSDNKVLEDVVKVFTSENCDIVYGDIDIVGMDETVIRRWVSGELNNGSLIGKQLPHPAFFVKREALSNLSKPFDPKYKISADFKQQLLLINKHQRVARYLPRALVHMRTGGASSKNFAAIIRGWNECMRAYKEINGSNGWLFIFRKVARKIPHFFNKR